MFPISVLCVFCLWSLTPRAATFELVQNTVPRKIIPLKSNGGRFFREKGVWNYTTMLLREDLNLLILGAREAIFALDLNDITNKKAMVKWPVTSQQQTDCFNKGKDAEIDCRNYIRILLKKKDGQMYVCGTKAFNPTCDYMSYTDGQLVLENKPEDGKGICPFDPFQRYTSELVDDELFSATSMTFRGSEPIMMRTSHQSVRTEYKSTWLNEPNFIHMAHIPEGKQSPEGDDDKIYLFFSETALEYDSYSKVDVSRVARVCRGDLGGQRTLQKKWTSFLKARLDCPVPNVPLPLLVQDVFHFCPDDWTNCVFYAIFTPQSASSQYSAVCAYAIGDIRTVFSKSTFMAQVPVEMSFVKWVTYSGDLPDPRPGACIDNHAREKGFATSLDLPDKTLQFVKDKPLMSQEVNPLGRSPLLVKSGADFTRIVVTAATALNGEKHHVMFIGTMSGSVLKAVNYGGEMLIMEEMQLFESSEPVKILKLLNTALYVGSEAGAVQISITECGRYQACVDCVLARDPYCGWDLEVHRCVTINGTHTASSVIQSLGDGNASRCPPTETIEETHVSYFRGHTVKLWCRPYSNLAQVQWTLNGQAIQASDTFQILSDSLMVLNATEDAEGHYTCSSVETVSEQEYKTRHAEYQLEMWHDSGTKASLHAGTNESAVVIILVITLLLLAGLVTWNLYKGHLTFPCCTKKEGVL